MRIAIVGSRNYTDADGVVEYVNSLPDDTIVITGGADGVDSIAEGAARKRGLEVIIYRPDWDTFGRAAGPIGCILGWLKRRHKEFNFARFKRRQAGKSLQR